MTNEQRLAAVILKILKQATHGGMGNHHMYVPRAVLDEASELLSEMGL